MNAKNQSTASSLANDFEIKKESSASHSRAASSVTNLPLHSSTPHSTSQADRLISDDMGTEILQVVVGPEKTVFSVHKDLLLPTGPAFIKAFDPDINHKKRITMTKEDPETFKLFVELLYTRQVPAVAPAMSEEGKAHRLVGLCKLYVFAEAMKVLPTMQNQIFDKVQDGFLLLDELPNASLISSVYCHTRPSSKFRKFIAACLVFQVRNTPNLDGDMMIQIFKLDPQIMKDFLRTVHLFVPGQDPRIRSSSEDSGYVNCDSICKNENSITTGVSPHSFHILVD
ncbi:hypothetical protein K3495_g3899 [Podosphaera aphanis]|nr:hypothetical protein K3495_g3899 [Podosphaera aphanis]